MNRAFLNDRSGDKWDLFFAGVSEYAPMEEDASTLLDPYWSSDWGRYFNPRIFSDVEDAVTRGHRRVLSEDKKGEEPWRYSGNTDLVSFMVYQGEPDWLTLISVPLEMSLGQLTEGLKGWEADDLDPDLAPGESLYTGGSLPLTEALRWSATMIAGGVLANGVYDLLRLIGRPP